MNKFDDSVVDYVELVTRIKKDPKCHYDNFQIQYTHFERLCDLLIIDPSVELDELVKLISFVSIVIFNYKDYVRKFVDKLLFIIEKYGYDLDSSLRMIMCKVLLKQKNENNVDAIKVFKALIELFNCKDKILRKTLQHLFIQNIKNSNKKHYNNKTNTIIQNYFFKIMQNTIDTKENQTKILAILNIVITLWNKNIWKNDKIINMISYVCFNNNYKISFTAIKFFLGNNQLNDNDNNDSEDEDDDEIKKRDALMMIKSNKCDTKSNLTRTNRKRKRKLDKALEYINKIDKKKKSRLNENSIGDSSAIRLLNDPQTFCDKLLKKFNKIKNRFEIKVIIMEVIARTISIHQLIVPSFYTLIQRYLRPQQECAVRILTALVQACHKLIPEEYLCACIKTIALNFISQHSVSEYAAVGMNTIREICWRCPNAIEESLAQELVSLQKGINNSGGVDKILSLASKSLLQTLRVVNPKILLRKDRVRSIYGNKLDIFYNSNDYDFNLNDLTAPKIYTTIPGLEEYDNKNSECDTETETSFINNENSEQNSQFNTDSEDLSQNNQVENNECEINLNEQIFNRFLTDEEFKTIRRKKLKYEAKKLSEALGVYKKREELNVESSDDEINKSMHGDDILGLDKVGFVSGLKKKNTRPELLANNIGKTISTMKKSDERKIAGKEYRKKVFNEWRFNPEASKTNREKSKAKPFKMVKHKRKINEKSRKTMKQKIATIRKTIKNASKIRK